MGDETRSAINRLLEIDRAFASSLSDEEHDEKLSELFEALGELRQAVHAESGLSVEAGDLVKK